MKEYCKPQIHSIEIEYNSIICASEQKNINDVPDEVKDLYAEMTMKQKAAAMNMMAMFGGSVPPTPKAISEVNKIMTFAGKSMQISGKQYKSYQSEFPSVKEMIEELKGIHNKATLDSLFYAMFCIVSIGKSEQAATALLNIFSQLGYSEDDCINVVKKMELISQL